MIEAGGGAPNHVLDLAEDATAGGGAVLGRVPGGLNSVEAAREGDAAADGSGDAVEGGCKANQGVWDGNGWRGGRRGLRQGVLLRGRGGLLCSLGGRLLMQEAGEASAHVDQVVQDMAVVVRVRGVLAGGVRLGFGWGGGRGWLGRHGQNKNIVGLGVSRPEVSSASNWFCDEDRPPGGGVGTGRRLRPAAGGDRPSATCLRRAYGHPDRGHRAGSPYT